LATRLGGQAMRPRYSARSGACRAIRRSHALDLPDAQLNRGDR